MGRSWENGLVNAAAVWAADRASAAPNWRRQSCTSPKGANSVFDGGHAAAITEPHPRLSDCQPAGFQNARPQRAALKRIGRKPSPDAKLARFESPAKGFNGIITKL
jgi:hypothetical protein